MLKYFFFIFAIITGYVVAAQDSIPPVRTDAPRHRAVVRIPHRVKKPADSMVVLHDYLLSPAGDRKLLPVKNFDADTMMFGGFGFFRFTHPQKFAVTIKKWEGKEDVFYPIIALLIFFALIKNSFHRYITDLLKIFFRTSVKQRQIKEQLLQTPLPSLLLNFFFLMSIGMFLSLLLHYFKLGMEYNFWVLFLYVVIGLVFIYGIKFLSLKIFGWIFQVSEATDSYIFIVFTTNKIIGMALLPFIVLLAFTYGMANEAAMTLGIMVMGALFAYRFFLSYVSIQRQISISILHFFLYLCAFELAPLLLINKLLFRFLGETS